MNQFWTLSPAAFLPAYLVIFLLAVFTAAVLRVGQGRVIDTKLFDFARAHGLTGAAWLLVRTIGKRQFRTLLVGFASDWLTVFLYFVGLPLVLGASALIASAVIVILFTVAGLPAGGDRLATIFTAAGIWMILSAWYWLRGLAYAARPVTRRPGGLPRLRLPGAIADPRDRLAARDRLALRVYWYSQIHSLWLVPISMVPFAILTGSTIGLPARYASEHQNTAATAGTAGFMLVSIVAYIAFIEVLERMPVIARVESDICVLLDPRETERERTGLVTDPLEWRRPRLARLAAHLAEAARSLDARQPWGSAPHPTATLFRATAAHLRRYLQNQRSLSRWMPADITNILEAAALLLAMPSNAAAYDALLKLVPAFGPDGQPDVEAEGKPPGRFLVAVSRTAEGLNGLSTTLKSILAIVAIVIAVIVYALHGGNPSNLFGLSK